MKNYLLKLYVVILLSLFFSQKVMSITNDSLTVFNPALDSLHPYYNICLSHDHMLRCDYYYSSSGTTRLIYIPHRACILDSIPQLDSSLFIFSSTSSDG